MQTIQLEIRDDYIDRILDFLKLLPENVAKIQISDNNFQIDKNHCIKTLNKINRGEIEDFQIIDDVDVHIEELKNALS